MKFSSLSQSFSRTAVLGIFAVCAGCAHQSVTAIAAPPVSGFDADLTTYPYPYPVKFFNFESQKLNLRMAYMDVAPAKANGRTIVLLHGKNFSGAYWQPTAEFLSLAGFRVIIPDQIGFGKSTKPAAYQFSIQLLAQNTHALLESLGIAKPLLIGHSMGGMIAARYALMYPDGIERLALISPLGLEDWRKLTAYHSVDQLYQQELKSTPESILNYQKQNYFGGEWKHEYDPLLEVPIGWNRGPDRDRIAWNSALTSDMIFTGPVLYEFPMIQAKTLLMVGSKDRTALGKAWAKKEIAEHMGEYPKLAESAARVIPHIKLIEMKNSGHLPQINEFEAYKSAILDFVQSN